MRQVNVETAENHADLNLAMFSSIINGSNHKYPQLTHRGQKNDRGGENHMAKKLPFALFFLVMVVLILFGIGLSESRHYTHVAPADGVLGRNKQCSQSLYLCRDQMGTAGRQGTKRETTAPATKTYAYSFAPTADKSEVISQYANFNHRMGGDTRPMYPGSAENIRYFSQKLIVNASLIAGCLLTICIFYTGVFLLYSRKPYFLAFALCCLFAALQVLLTGDKVITMFLPILSWHAAMAAKYLCTNLITVTFTVYLATLLPKLLHKVPVRIFYVWSFLYGLLVLLSVPWVYSQFLFLYQIGLAVFALYVLVRLAIKLKTCILEEAMLFIGAAVFVLGTLLDMVALRYIMTTNHVADFSNLSMLACVFINMMALALHFSRTKSELEGTRLHERELAETNAILNRLNKMKAEFMTNISHELKTLLTVMSVYAQLSSDSLKSGTAEPETCGDLDIVSREAQRLSGMMGCLLDLARIQESSAGMGPVHLGDILVTTARLYRPMLARKGNMLALDLPESMPPMWGNADQISHVLLNLLANANAHTENGKITLQAGQQCHVIAVTVADTGAGIAPEALPHVFERFQTTRETGSGLGLFICREIVQAHGGEITAESEVGKGTVLTFTLPMTEGTIDG